VQTCGKGTKVYGRSQCFIWRCLTGEYSVASLIIDKDKKIPRRNDSLNIDHENCRLDLATGMSILIFWVCYPIWLGLCITKAITFEKGYHTSEIQVPDIDFQRVLGC